LTQFYTLDPLLDNRWDDLVATHPRASIFHRKGWLRALAMTYGYRPMVLTTSPGGGPLSDGMVFCEVKSWITGNRLVSLPFADHCEPLLNGAGDAFELTDWMEAERRRHGWRYIELRPLLSEMPSSLPLAPSQSFWFHTLSLTPSIDQLFSGMHKSCIQRRIGRARREHLSYEKGCSEDIVNDFYRLLMITRRRHHMLPQPRVWFRNLVACLSPNVEVRLVRKDTTPVAAILTLHHGHTVVYKYGCSDERFHHLAGMPLLFWKLIEESKAVGAEQIDFGRTDLDNDGLIMFKDRLGTTRRKLRYSRYPETVKNKVLLASDPSATRRMLSVLPDTVLSQAARLVYRHVG
jgi:hypothetical protein